MARAVFNQGDLPLAPARFHDRATSDPFPSVVDCHNLPVIIHIYIYTHRVGPRKKGGSVGIWSSSRTQQLLHSPCGAKTKHQNKSIASGRHGFVLQAKRLGLFQMLDFWRYLPYLVSKGVRVQFAKPPQPLRMLLASLFGHSRSHDCPLAGSRFQWALQVFVRGSNTDRQDETLVQTS